METHVSMRGHRRFILITLDVVGLVTVLAWESGDVPVSSQTAGPSGRLSPANWFLRVCGDFRQFSFQLLCDVFFRQPQTCRSQKKVLQFAGCFLG